jgi:hypothetical protein
MATGCWVHAAGQLINEQGTVGQFVSRQIGIDDVSLGELALKSSKNLQRKWWPGGILLHLRYEFFSGPQLAFFLVERRRWRLGLIENFGKRPQNKLLVSFTPHATNLA